ncbi:MAG: NFACT RNA binding domain-containing protein [Ignavibacterium album]|uniref:NFACT RNA binding domain-containing protein n=1 Tax=Ignavibacterium album TaxID=591197 RepID=UPI0026EF3E13|nr:NFACT RNA binding domain-containing protein [Ignavibacterium album]MCX8105319.1 NFACT RNA binding domain-containing protein [Ignavibacterium album]
MIKSYFFLNRQILELKEILLNKKVLSVFTQEKDKLVIEFEEDDQLYLEFCVNHSLPYIHLKDFYIRAKKNSLELFEFLKGKIITNVLIAESDRVVAITFNDTTTIFFTIRGKYTNVYLKHFDEFLSFKKIAPEDLKTIETDLTSNRFICEFNVPDFSVEDNQYAVEKLKVKYPFIGKEIFNYAGIINASTLTEAIIKVITIIKNNNPVVVSNYKSYEVNLVFKGLPIELNDLIINEFKNLNDAIGFYFKEIFHLSSIKEIRDQILKHIDKELRRITNKQNNLLTIIEMGDKESEYKKIAELLLINNNNLKSGMDSVTLKDIYENEKLITIKLEPKLSPKENINKYFQKAKESKIQFQKATELIKTITDEKNRLSELKNKAITAASLKELSQIAKQLKIKMKTEKNIPESIADKFKQYIIDGKYKVFVGKDSKSNDLLTLKFAKQNDYWFHARAVPGSHVLLSVENSKEPIPKSVLKKVASLAAFHSKAKTAGVVPVSYTLKKFVVKRKGMEPGKVALLREDTLLVTPEIPAGAEFIES